MKTTNFQVTRISSGEFTFRVERELLRTYLLQWLLGRTYQEDKRREVRAPSYFTRFCMDIEIAKSVVGNLLQDSKTFDSHAFIRAFIKTYPSVYGQMLIEYDNVTVAHSVIANFLLNNSKELGIERMNEDNMSRDIFDIETPCAGWRVLTKK